VNKKERIREGRRREKREEREKPDKEASTVEDESGGGVGGVRVRW